MPFSMRRCTSAWLSLWGMVMDIVLAMQVLRKKRFWVPSWNILILTPSPTFGGVIGSKNGQTGIYYRGGSEWRSACRPSGGASARTGSTFDDRGAWGAGNGRGGGDGSSRDHQAGGDGVSGGSAGGRDVEAVSLDPEIF